MDLTELCLSGSRVLDESLRDTFGYARFRRLGFSFASHSLGFYDIVSTQTRTCSGRYKKGLGCCQSVGSQSVGLCMHWGGGDHERKQATERMSEVFRLLGPGVSYQGIQSIDFFFGGLLSFPFSVNLLSQVS